MSNNWTLILIKAPHFKVKYIRRKSYISIEFVSIAFIFISTVRNSLEMLFTYMQKSLPKLYFVCLFITFQTQETYFIP